MPSFAVQLKQRSQRSFPRDKPLFMVQATAHHQNPEEKKSPPYQCHQDVALPINAAQIIYRCVLCPANQIPHASSNLSLA
jgi:hypothetical protein